AAQIEDHGVGLIADRMVERPLDGRHGGEVELAGDADERDGRAVPDADAERRGAGALATIGMPGDDRAPAAAAVRGTGHVLLSEWGIGSRRSQVRLPRPGRGPFAVPSGPKYHRRWARRRIFYVMRPRATSTSSCSPRATSARRRSSASQTSAWLV